MINPCICTIHIDPSTKYPPCKQRLFRRHRDSLFNAKSWSSFLSNTWESIKSTAEQTKQFTNSLLGKVIIFGVAEFVGSKIVESVSSPLLGSLSSNALSYTVPALIIGSTLISAPRLIFSSAAKTSKAADYFFALASILSTVLVLTVPINQLSEFGESVGQTVGTYLGSTAGVILGGYAGLRLSGSKIIFWDSTKPLDSYAVSMVRYIAAGNLFNSVIATPSTPYVNTILQPIRQITCSIVQTVAYSSNSLLPFIAQSFRTRVFSNKLLTPLLAELITNRFHCCEKDSPSITKIMAQKTFSTFAVLPSIVERGLKIGLDASVDSLINKTPSFINITLRSLHEYSHLLSNSEEVKAAHREFKQAYFDSSYKSLYQCQQERQQLINVIKGMVLKNSSFSEKLVQSTLERILNDSGIKDLSTTMISKVQELEIEVVGIPRLSKSKAPFLKEIIDIYLVYFILFTLSNIRSLSMELTPSEEQEIVIDANNFVISSYIRFIMPQFVASVIRHTTNTVINLSFKVRSCVFSLLQQPEQTTHLSFQPDLRLVEGHFEPPKIQDLFKDCIEIPSKKQLKQDMIAKFEEKKSETLQINDVYFA